MACLPQSHRPQSADLVPYTKAELKALASQAPANPAAASADNPQTSASPAACHTHKFGAYFLPQQFIRRSKSGQALRAVMDDTWYQRLEMVLMTIMLYGLDGLAYTVKLFCNDHCGSENAAVFNKDML